MQLTTQPAHSYSIWATMVTGSQLTSSYGLLRIQFIMSIHGFKLVNQQYIFSTLRTITLNMAKQSNILHSYVWD